MQIEYVEWGLASKFKDKIEINKNLLKPEYKDILDFILKHEEGHKTNSLTIDDLRHDLNIPLNYRILGFMFKHPKTLITYLPIWYYKKQLVIDWGILFFWGVFAAVVFLVYSYARYMLG